MKTYRGWRITTSTVVVVENMLVAGSKTTKNLPTRTDLRRHANAGFEWGDDSGGAAQLALSICCDALLNDELAALGVYQAFKSKVISALPKDEFELSEMEVFAAFAEIRKAG